MTSMIAGQWKFGTLEAGSNEDGYLGSEYELLDESFDGKELFALQNPNRVFVKWVKNVGATTLAPGSLVKRAVGGDMAWGVEAAAATNPACGVVDPFLKRNVAVGEKFLIVTRGRTKVRTGGAVAKGATLGVGAGVAATNALATVADLTHAFGVLQETAGGAGLFQAEVNFPVLK